MQDLRADKSCDSDVVEKMCPEDEREKEATNGYEILDED